MYYLTLDKDSYLTAYGVTYDDVETANGMLTVEELDEEALSGIRMIAYRWDGVGLVLDEERLARLEKEETEQMTMPTLEERNRADIDFLLIMGGYDL